MKIAIENTNPLKINTPAMIVFLGSDDQSNLESRPDLAELARFLTPRLTAGDFKAKHLDLLTLFPDGAGPQRLILVGLGPDADWSPPRLREAAAKGVRTAMDLKVEEAAVLLPPVRGKLNDPAQVAEYVTLGSILGQQDLGELKTKEKDKKKPLSVVTLVANDAAVTDSLLPAMDRAEVVAEAVFLARSLGNRPANLLFPENLADETVKLARTVKLEATVLDMDEARRRGMGAFIGVAQGSHHPGRVIVLEYRGADRKSPPVALIGKAITFDSGGISIKGAEGMHLMKTDMAGGAAVLAVIVAAARLRLQVNIVAVIPAAENMPGGQAYRPGDVLTSMSGQTIEIINTDAEGRLILADGLTLALTYKPRCLIDLATLTGSCVIALGEKCAGLLSNNDELSGELTLAGQTTGERLWRLPLLDDYFEKLKSDIADFKNAGTRQGGTIIGGLFLKQFVNDTPWAHLDIAGPAREEKGTPDMPAGATGYGVQLLLQYLRKNFS